MLEVLVSMVCLEMAAEEAAVADKVEVLLFTLLHLRKSLEVYGVRSLQAAVAAEVEVMVVEVAVAVTLASLDALDGSVMVERETAVETEETAATAATVAQAVEAKVIRGLAVPG